LGPWLRKNRCYPKFYKNKHFYRKVDKNFCRLSRQGAGRFLRFRARSGISSQIFGVAAPGWQSAKVMAYREYAGLSQRSQASMQRRSKCEVIFECALTRRQLSL